MLRAVTYSRFSSEIQKEKSIEDQQRKCHQHAEMNDWTVIDDYKDSALSGKLIDRPSYTKMMRDAESGAFDVIIVDDLSRLTRGTNATEILEQLRFCNVRLIAISDGIDSENNSAKIQVGFSGIVNNLFLDQLREKVHRGLMGNALNGKNTGGRSYGYKHIPDYHLTKTDIYGRPEIISVDREIDEEQAKWVRQIFEWVVEDRSYKWIASELNRLKVPTVKGGSWTTSTLCGNSSDAHSGILNNPIYIGKNYWNRTKVVQNPKTGKSISKRRDESEWVINERPDLRIISDKLWQAVKIKQQLRYKKTQEKKNSSHQRARTGAGPKYLLSGILKCPECNSNYIIIRPGMYGCSGAYKHGDAVCSNTGKLPKDEIEKSLISSIQLDLFLPEAIAVFRQEAAVLIKKRKLEYEPNVRKLRAELRDTDKGLNSLLDFIERGGMELESISARLSALESKKRELVGEIERESALIQDIEPIIPRAMDKYRELVENLPSACKGHIPPLREKIRSLLGGEVKVGPADDGGWEGTYRGAYNGLLRLGADGSNISDGTL